MKIILRNWIFAPCSFFYEIFATLLLTVMDLPVALVLAVLSAVLHALIAAHLRQFALELEQEPLDAQVSSVLR